MNQIVLHNYSAWSMAAVLHEMSKSLTDKLEQSPPRELSAVLLYRIMGISVKGNP